MKLILRNGAAGKGRVTGLLILLAFVLGTTGAAGGSGGEPSPEPLINITFPGGSATAYIAAVRKAAGDLNIVTAPEAAEVPMPAVTLRGVTATAALNLLHDRTLRQPGRAIKLIVRSMPTYELGEQHTFVVRAEVRSSRRERVETANVWTVAGLLDNDIPSTSVLSAVEMALDALGSDTPLDVRYHEGTGLLIATGDEGQLETINLVLDRLSDAVAQRHESKMAKLRMSLISEDRIQQLEADLEALREENRGMHHELTRRELMQEELRRMLDFKQRELESASREIHALERALQQERSRSEQRGRSGD